MTAEKDKLVKFALEARGQTRITLTGSRRFLKSDSSDWDFVVSANPHMCPWDNTETTEESWKLWLESNGYKRIYDGYKLTDTDTKAIWEKKYGFNERDKIQVVFSKNYDAKRRIILWLEKRPELINKYYSVPKNERHTIWEYLQDRAERGDI